MSVIAVCITTAVLAVLLSGLVSVRTDRTGEDVPSEESVTDDGYYKEAPIGPALRSYADKELRKRGFAPEDFFYRNAIALEGSWLERISGAHPYALVMELRFEVYCARGNVPNEEAAVSIDISHRKYRLLMAQDASAPANPKPADVIDSDAAAVGIAQKALAVRSIDVKGTAPDVSASEAFWVVKYITEGTGVVTTVLISKKTGDTRVFQTDLNKPMQGGALIESSEKSGGLFGGHP